MSLQDVKLIYEREDAYVIGNNGKGTPLGCVLVYVQEVSGPIYVLHHKTGSVAIKV